MKARVLIVVVRDREFPGTVMEDQELVLKIMEVLEGSTSLPDWMVGQGPRHGSVDGQPGVGPSCWTDSE